MLTPASMGAFCNPAFLWAAPKNSVSNVLRTDCRSLSWLDSAALLVRNLSLLNTLCSAWTLAGSNPGIAVRLLDLMMLQWPPARHEADCLSANCKKRGSTLNHAAPALAGHLAVRVMDGIHRDAEAC